jgi:uncharacterized protein (TIGR03435 family)
MPDANDIALLREYAARNSEFAFAEIVHRHINLVYSVALRFTGNCEDAQDVTQAVFIILARKAASLRQKTILTGWLYETTRFTAMKFLRTKARQQALEQEAYMQSTLNDSNPDGVWKQLAPLLEEAMARLNEKERTLLALRFFENKSGAETAAILGIQEWAARKRVGRAMKKLQHYFSRCGVNSTAAAIAGAISANSVQAAPIGLAKIISAVAIAKGAAASTSTLTLIKGALKIMAWTKMKTAIVAGAVVLLAAGTTTVTVKEIQNHRTYPWQVQNANSDILRKVPPQVGIAPAKYPNTMGAGSVSINDGRFPSSPKTMGIAQSLEDIISSAYGQSSKRTIFLTKIPPGRFDYIANLPSGNEEALQKEIEKKFGLAAHRETRDTDVLLLEVQNPNATGLKYADSRRLEPHSESSGRSGAGYITFRNQSLSSLAWSLESRFKTPVIDQTGLTNQYDIDLNWDETDFQHPNLNALKQALLDQLGLELVPTNMPIKMLVIEKAN